MLSHGKQFSAPKLKNLATERALNVNYFKLFIAFAGCGSEKLAKNAANG